MVLNNRNPSQKLRTVVDAPNAQGAVNIIAVSTKEQRSLSRSKSPVSQEQPCSRGERCAAPTEASKINIIYNPQVINVDLQKQTHNEWI